MSFSPPKTAGPAIVRVTTAPLPRVMGPLTTRNMAAPAPPPPGVCKMGSEPSEQANGTCSESSVVSAESETNEQIYNFGSLTIILDTILCFIATKKFWALMLLCEQLKKHYAPADIAKAHNIVIELSDARRPRLTTCDTKRRITVTINAILATW